MLVSKFNTLIALLVRASNMKIGTATLNLIAGSS